MIERTSRCSSPGFLDHDDFLLADSLDFQKLFRLGFDDVEGRVAEFFYHPLGGFRSDPLHHPRAEVLLDRGGGRGPDGLVALHPKLAAMLRVLVPAPVDSESLPLRRAGSGSYQLRESCRT